MFQQFFEQSLDAVFIETPAGKILDCNRKAIELFGYTKTEFLGLSIKDLISQAYLKKNPLAVKDFLKKKNVLQEAEYQKKDGSTIVAEMNFRQLKITGQNFLLVIIRDISHHKKIEAALVEEKEKIKQYLEIAGIIMLVLDNQGRVSIINKKGCKVLGYKEKDIVGKKWFDNFLPVRFRKSTAVVFKKIIAGQMKGVEFYENPIINSRGEERIIAWHNSLIKDKKGKILATLSSGEDITEKKAAEEALEKSRTWFFTTLNSIGDGAIATDQQGRVKFINLVARKIIGCREKEAIGKRLEEIFEVVNEKTGKKIIDPVSLVLRSGKIIGLVNHAALKTKDGRLISIEDSAAPIKDSKGKIFGTILIFHDVVEKRRAQRLLEESEQNFRTIFEDSSVGMVTVSLDKKFLRANKTACKFYGYSEKELKTKTFVDLTHPDEVNRDVISIQKMLLGKLKVYQVDKRYIRKDKKVIWGRIKVTLIRGKNKKPLYFLTVIEDITKNIEVEKKLKETRLQLENISNSLEGGMIYQILRLKDGTRKFLYLSDKVKEFYGVTPKQALDDPHLIYDRVFPDDRKRLFVEEEKANKNLTVLKIEARMINPKGKIRWSSFISSPTKMPDGVTCWNGIEFDITELKNFEEKLKESEEKYSNLVEKSNDGIVLIQDGKVTFLNQNMSKMMGFSVKEGLDRNFLDFVAPEDRKMVYEKYVARLQGKKVETRYEFNLVDKNKNKLPIEANVSLINFSGQIGIMAVVRDMTKSKENEKIKSEFVSVTSHQMRTPLTGIKWFTELLLTKKAGVLSDKQTDYLQQVQISNERMIKLVDDLLSVSRMESTEKFKVSTKPEDVVKIFHQVIDGEKVISDKKNIKIIHEGKCLESFVVNIDREKFFLVLQNILDNAIKYSSNNSTIFVRCRPEKTNLIFSITDCGIGIPKKQQHRMFERFFRADNVISTQPGTGLGLYIAKYIVEKHNGKIWFESEENKGTTFYVSLPIDNSKKQSSIIK